jgi:exosome complex component RRP46
MTLPDASLSHLHRADGSATYSQNGYSIIGAVNGPIEVGRRDELPEEATIDVIVRPAVGVGGILFTSLWQTEHQRR